MYARTYVEPEDIITPNNLFRHLDENPPPKIAINLRDYLNIPQDNWRLPRDDPAKPLSHTQDDVSAAQKALEDIVRGCSKEILLDSEIEEMEGSLERVRTGSVYCDRQLYYRAASMLRIHKSRMNKEKLRSSFYDFRIRRPYSSRLPTPLAARSYAKEELFKRDKAPFTVRRPGNQQEFLRASRDPENDELRKLEKSAYDATLKDMAITRKSLKLVTLRALAADRGVRRAALQLALRAFAGNEEQRYSGESIYRYVPLPQPNQTLQPPAQSVVETLPVLRPLRVDLSIHGVLSGNRTNRGGWRAWLRGAANPGQRTKCMWNRAGLRSSTPVGLRLQGKIGEPQKAIVYHSGGIEEWRVQKLVSAFQNRPTKKHLDHIFKAFQFGMDSLQSSIKQRDVDTFLGVDQDIKDTPLSESERSDLWAFARAPAPPSDEAIPVRDRHRLLGFGAGRQYAQLRSYLNRANYKILERDINEQNRIVQATFNDTRGALITLFPRFAAAHFLTTKAIAKSIPGPPNDVKMVELLRAEVCRENHEDRRESELDLAQLWSFTDYLLPSRKDEVHFSMERWPPKPCVEAPSRTFPERSIHGMPGYKNLKDGNHNPTFRLAPEDIGLMVVSEANRDTVGHKTQSTRSITTQETQFSSVRETLGRTDTEITLPSISSSGDTKRGPPGRQARPPKKQKLSFFAI